MAERAIGNQAALDKQLLEAVTSGSLSEVKNALDKGANVNAKNEGQLPVLSQAVLNGHIEVVRLLLERKADVNVGDKGGNTALHHAAVKGDKEVVEALLDAGADVDKKTMHCSTSLHLAVEKGRKEAVRVLLNHGAIPTRRTLEGKSARDLAIEVAKSDEIRKLLEEPPIIKAHPPTRTASRPLESDATRKAVCEYFRAQLTISARFGRQPLPFFRVHDLIYPDTDEKLEQIRGIFAKSAASVAEDAWTWIHLPANNIRWVKDLFDTLSAIKSLSNIEYEKIRNFLDKSFYEHEGQCQARFRKPLFEKLDRIGNTFSVVMPYIDMETEAYINCRDMMDRAKGKQLEDSEEHFKQMRDLEKAYMTLGELHVSRTLDQSYYAALEIEDQIAKALGQVAYRYTKDIAEKERDHLNHSPGPTGDQLTEERIAKERAQVKQSTVIETPDDAAQSDETLETQSPEDPAKPRKQAKFLMVNQLWLWKLDARTVITAFPQRWSRGGEDTLLEWILGSRFCVESLPSVDDLIRHILQQTITSIEEPYKSGLDEDCFDIFQCSIAKVENEAATYHTKFADALRSRSEQPQATTSKAAIDCDTEDDNGTTEEAHIAKEADIAKATDIPNEMAHLTEIRDIRDELHMIRQVLEDQEDVLRKIKQRLKVKFDQRLSDDYKKDKQHENHQVLRSDQKLSMHMEDLLEEQKFRIQRLKRLDENAHRVETSLQNLLDLQQKQTTIQMAKDTKEQSAVLMIFTVFTVIFAPLAFLVALLAVNVDTFPDQWKSGRVIGILIGGELVTSFLVFLGCYGYQKYSDHSKNHGWFRWIKVEKVPKGESSVSNGSSTVTMKGSKRWERPDSSSLRERRKREVPDCPDMV